VADSIAPVVPTVHAQREGALPTLRASRRVNGKSRKRPCCLVVNEPPQPGWLGQCPNSEVANRMALEQG